MSLENLKNKRIVIVGDSHTDLYPFGERLVTGLRDAGADVTVLAIGGTAASSWLGKKQPLCRKAAMGKPETKVAELCAELGITRQTLYRHVTPDGQIRPDGEKLLARRNK